MNTELRLPGRSNDNIEYFATAAGHCTTHHLLYHLSGHYLQGA